MVSIDIVWLNFDGYALTDFFLTILCLFRIHKIHRLCRVYVKICRLSVVVVSSMVWGALINLHWMYTDACSEQRLMRLIRLALGKTKPTILFLIKRFILFYVGRMESFCRDLIVVYSIDRNIGNMCNNTIITRKYIVSWFWHKAAQNVYWQLSCFTI